MKFLIRLDLMINMKIDSRVMWQEIYVNIFLIENRSIVVSKYGYIYIYIRNIICWVSLE